MSRVIMMSTPKAKPASLALLHGSGNEMTWSLAMAQSCEAKGVWFGDADHAVESMYGDRGLACLSVV